MRYKLSLPPHKHAVQIGETKYLRIQRSHSDDKRTKNTLNFKRVNWLSSLFSSKYSCKEELMFISITWNP